MKKILSIALVAIFTLALNSCSKEETTKTYDLNGNEITKKTEQTTWENFPSSGNSQLNGFSFINVNAVSGTGICGEQMSDAAGEHRYDFDSNQVTALSASSGAWKKVAGPYSYKCGESKIAVKISDKEMKVTPLDGGTVGAINGVKFFKLYFDGQEYKSDNYPY